MGVVQRWATQCIIEVAGPEGRQQFRPDAEMMSDGVALAAWLTAGAQTLVDEITARGADAATWHPFGGDDRTVGLWARRLAQEVLVHRWDAQDAVGLTTPLDPELASDGVDEYLGLLFRGLVTDDNRPHGSLHLHCTDVTGEWLARFDDDTYVLTREHAKGDAAWRGPAEPMLLGLWGRSCDRTDEMEVLGTAEVASSWLAIGGR